MTTERLLSLIEEIKHQSWDNELAHAMEDQLRHEVLQAIANGAENAIELAKIALTTSEIQFLRWYV